jgi:hypothetical protein
MRRGVTRPERPAPSHSKKRWEDEKVKRAALAMAGGFPNARKLKICYVLNDDEWSVTIYDDIGTAIDLKQYFWDRDKESLEPFLVVKRIPRSRLDEYAEKSEPGEACEVIDLSPSGGTSPRVGRP